MTGCVVLIGIVCLEQDSLLVGIILRAAQLKRPPAGVDQSVNHGTSLVEYPYMMHMH